MTIKSALLSVVFFCLACGGSDDPDFEPRGPISEDPISTPTPGKDWNLVFEENFDGDLSLWKIWESGAFNNEIQLYRTEQVTLDAGVLLLTTQREAIVGATYPYDATPKEFEYVSGRMETLAQFGPSNTQGELEYRFVARIQLPKGHGMWPAFWSTSDPWPTNGEIDILEARGGEPTKFQSNIFYGTEANTPITKNEDTEKVHELNVDLTEDFHIYELIWRSNSLEIKFDDTTVHKYTADSKNHISNLFGKKQQLILNVAVGGIFFSGIDSSIFADSATMKVDWVKVYKR